MNTQSCDMIRVFDDEPIWDGTAAPGSFFIDADPTSGQRRMWFVTPDGQSGVIQSTAYCRGQRSASVMGMGRQRRQAYPYTFCACAGPLARLVPQWPHGELLMTIAMLHRLLGAMVAAGHGRKPVCIDKATFTDPRENDGPMILPVCEMELKWVLDAGEDGGIAVNKDGTERGRTTLVLGGSSYSPSTVSGDA